mmetsp:Transcript_59327/g.109678  ORF Transcript_59327/g.109678 Transcript_59327/m.109678 type:complete len:227 (-) Transcript_59327:52-732(-)
MQCIPSAHTLLGHNPLCLRRQVELFNLRKDGPCPPTECATTCLRLLTVTLHHLGPWRQLLIVWVRALAVHQELRQVFHDLLLFCRVIPTDRHPNYGVSQDSLQHILQHLLNVQGAWHGDLEDATRTEVLVRGTVNIHGLEHSQLPHTVCQTPEEGQKVQPEHKVRLCPHQTLLRFIAPGYNMAIVLDCLCHLRTKYQQVFVDDGCIDDPSYANCECPCDHNKLEVE